MIGGEKGTRLIKRDIWSRRNPIVSVDCVDFEFYEEISWLQRCMRPGRHSALYWKSIMCRVHDSST